jgi:diacylglycerol kinase (ATP)
VEVRFVKRKIVKVRIIINPASGKGETILPVINAAMRDAGIRWEASITHKSGDAYRIAKAAAEEKIDALVVYGGDGTVTEAIRGLLGSGTPLAILPGGSANVMATELGIPGDLEEACMLLGRGSFETKTIDVGRSGGLHFIVGMSMGYTADVIKGAGRQAKNRFGILAYVLSAFAALKTMKKVTYRLTVDGVRQTVRGLTCIIANTGNLGFSSISFDKHIDVSDGLLDVVVLRKANLSLFRLILVTLFRRERPDNLELVEHWQGRNITVSSRPQQTVQCDGDVMRKGPLRISVVPAAIAVLVPKAVKAQ